MSRREVREDLAAYAHRAWSGWMSYLFSRSVERVRFHSAAHDPDDLVIPGEWVRRWQRQVNTSYVDLTETEKDSDRKEAVKMIDILNQHVPTPPVGIVMFMFLFGLVVGFVLAFVVWWLT